MSCCCCPCKHMPYSGMQHPYLTMNKKNRTHCTEQNYLKIGRYLNLCKAVQNIGALQTITFEFKITTADQLWLTRTVLIQKRAQTNHFEHFRQHLWISHSVNSHQLEKLDCCKNMLLVHWVNSCLKLYHFCEAFWLLSSFCSYVINGKKPVEFF